jgi:Ca2+-transporting ATPase
MRKQTKAIIWPAYFDQGKTRMKGRRVPKNIAVQLGLKNPTAIMSGLELNNISDDELKSKISKISLFARVIPDQKLLIVNALKSNGEIVVMTGDGINDAPALKSANIGIAMGERGTDVAREASSVVLTDDDFSSIVEGVKTGRRIFDNIRKAMIYTLAAHVPIAGITLLAVIANWPLLLLPAHIVLLELIIDPSCSIVFEKEPEEKNIMKRKPRNSNEKVLNKNAIQLSLIQGLGLLIIIALIFKFSILINKTETEARALTFSALIFGNLCLIITNRSW